MISILCVMILFIPSYLFSFLQSMCISWWIFAGILRYLICHRSQAEFYGTCGLWNVKCALNWLKRSYKSCIRPDDTRLDSWTRSLNIRLKVGRKMSDTLGSITAITYSESRNVSNFPEFISPYCPEIQIQSSDQRFVALRNTEHECCMQSRHGSNV